jgi:hypothetical protein
MNVFQYVHITLWQVFRVFKSECTKHTPKSPSSHLESTTVLSGSMDSTVLDRSCKQNHTVFILGYQLASHSITFSKFIHRGYASEFPSF